MRIPVSLVLVGTPKATAIATKRADAVKRYTALRERLRKEGENL